MPFAMQCSDVVVSRFPVTLNLPSVMHHAFLSASVLRCVRVRSRAQVFNLLRILLARVSSEHLTSIWPVVLMELIRVFQVGSRLLSVC